MRLSAPVCAGDAITFVPADFRSGTLMLIKRAEKAAVVCKNRFSLVFSFLWGSSLFPPFFPLLPQRDLSREHFREMNLTLHLGEAYCHVSFFFFFLAVE